MSFAAPNHGPHIPGRGAKRQWPRGAVHYRRSAPAVAELVGWQVLVDVEQGRVRIRLQVDIEQGDDRLKALGVNDGPLLQRKGRSVEDERKMCRASERGPILELDRNGLALLGDVQDLGVSGEVDVVGEQKLERRLANEIFV